jgi:aryl-alcohol dehydrogenase-like predicted oxidoreductase
MEDTHMEGSNLGRSGLSVSKAALGTMNFGRSCDAAEAQRIVGEFLDAGGTLIDTADVYNRGSSEELVGKAISIRRDEVVLATKAGGPTAPIPNHGGLSRAHLTRALDGSLHRLQTDHIDLYQCHLPDPSTPIEETLATLDGFVSIGKVRYIGCSNFTVAQIVEAQWAAERLTTSRFVGLQAHYSLVAREIEAEILPACARHGLGVLAYSPLANGLLAGRYRRGESADPGSRLDQWLRYEHPAAGRWARATTTERNFAIADAVADVAAQLGTTSAAVAIAWLSRRPRVSSVILGPRNVEQLRSNLDGIDLVLPDTCNDALDTASAPTNHPVTGVPVDLAE